MTTHNATHTTADRRERTGAIAIHASQLSDRPPPFLDAMSET